MTGSNPIVVSVQTARDMLGGVGKTLVYSLIASGKLETVKLGRRRLVRVASISALTENLEEGVQ